MLLRVITAVPPMLPPWFLHIFKTVTQIYFQGNWKPLKHLKPSVWKNSFSIFILPVHFHLVLLYLCLLQLLFGIDAAHCPLLEIGESYRTKHVHSSYITYIKSNSHVDLLLPSFSFGTVILELWKQAQTSSFILSKLTAFSACSEFPSDVWLIHTTKEAYARTTRYGSTISIIAWFYFVFNLRWHAWHDAHSAFS